MNIETKISLYDEETLLHSEQKVLPFNQNLHLRSIKFDPHETRSISLDGIDYIRGIAVTSDNNMLLTNGSQEVTGSIIVAEGLDSMAISLENIDRVLDRGTITSVDGATITNTDKNYTHSRLVGHPVYGGFGNIKEKRFILSLGEYTYLEIEIAESVTVESGNDAAVALENEINDSIGGDGNATVEFVDDRFVIVFTRDSGDKEIKFMESVDSYEMFIGMKLVEYTPGTEDYTGKKLKIIESGNVYTIASINGNKIVLNESVTGEAKTYKIYDEEVPATVNVILYN